MVTPPGLEPGYHTCTLTAMPKSQAERHGSQSTYLSVMTALCHSHYMLLVKYKDKISLLAKFQRLLFYLLKEHTHTNQKCCIFVFRNCVARWTSFDLKIPHIDSFVFGGE